MDVADVCYLIDVVYSKDSEGYETKTENRKQRFCNWTEGVSQSEFYMSQKAGFEASASVNVFVGDYNKEKIVEFNGVRYNVIRTFHREKDYVTLILEEVVR